MRKIGRQLCVVVVLALFVLALSGNAQTAKTKSGFIATLDGARIHYLEVGLKGAQAPTILFVPGWTMPAWIWEQQIAHFSKTRRVVAMDPRGQGESSKPTEGYHPTVRARDIKAVVDQLRLAPVVLVGWSMGVGEVAAYVEQFGTADLAGIALVDGFAGADPSPQMTSAVLGLAGNFLKDRGKFTDEFVRSMYKKPHPETYIKKVVAASKQTPTSAGVALFVGMFTTDHRPVLGKIDKPTLICMAPSGPWDALYEDMHRWVAGSRLVKFEGAGHALFVDEAEKFNQLLGDFVRSLVRP